MNNDLNEIHTKVEQFITEIPPFPENIFKGRGIVTSCYDKEFESSWVLLNELKRLDINLNVEIFYKDGELSDIQKEIIQNLGEKFKLVELTDNVIGWAIKPFSIFRSSFEEVLWIDSDNCPTKNIEFLFDDPEYVQKGSLFWRDICNGSIKLQAWDVFNVPFNDSEEFESGQLLINKRKCWRELNLTLFYNINQNFYYQFLHGDKDTFKFAWQYLNKNKPYYQINYHSDSSLVPYGFMPYGPFHVGEPNMYGKWGGGSVLGQRDRNGEVLFYHRTINKFKLGNNVFQRQVENEKVYHEHIKNLEKIYVR